MAAAHTRSWRYDYEPGYCGEIIREDGVSVCTFNDEPDHDDQLLMIAAPDLLSIARRWAALYAGDWHAVRHANEKAELLADTRAAIAKATGSTS